jgi:hypothetical protein
MSGYHAADVLKLYRERIGDAFGPDNPGLGPVTATDLELAIEIVGATVEPNIGWSKVLADKLDYALEGIVRQRLPRYRVTWALADGRPTLALVHDPRGLLDNFKAASASFKRRAKADRDRRTARDQWSVKQSGGTLEGAALRRGVSESTLDNRRREIRALGGNPDKLAEYVPDE